MFTRGVVEIDDNAAQRREKLRQRDEEAAAADNDDTAWRREVESRETQRRRQEQRRGEQRRKRNQRRAEQRRKKEKAVADAARARIKERAAGGAARRREGGGAVDAAKARTKERAARDTARRRGGEGAGDAARLREGEDAVDAARRREYLQRRQEIDAADAAQRRDSQAVADATRRREEKVAAVDAARRRDQKSEKVGRGNLPASGKGQVEVEDLAAERLSVNKENKPPRKSRAAERQRVVFSPTLPESDGDHDRGSIGVFETPKQKTVRRRKELAEERWKRRRNRRQSSDDFTPGGKGPVETEDLVAERVSVVKEGPRGRKSKATERPLFSPSGPESAVDHDDGIIKVDESIKQQVLRTRKGPVDERAIRRQRRQQQTGERGPEIHEESTDVSEPRTSSRIRGSKKAEQQIPPSCNLLTGGAKPSNGTDTRKADDSAVQSPRHDSRQNTATLKVSNGARTLTADSRQRPRKPRKAHQVDTHAPDQRQGISAKHMPVNELAANPKDQQHTSTSRQWEVSGRFRRLPFGLTREESWVLESMADGVGRKQQHIEDEEEEAEVEADSDAAPSEHGSEYTTEDGEGVSDGESDVEGVSDDEDGGHS
ncbi:hypothetical protein LTR56_013068 [Elasticomyces elasticus]|nr:hypothetical protein LTR56_013068 [Elasticomyces elasticus]KAK3640247.1 hypothetical protein LTR22_017082 [Elasticomyces elasticus]KAK4920524.1 hypothetical protein LTR49_011939 [Elasticomyces elasticus]KAK5758976.1 hypothetical protein LTS12_010917 [Elasticomyces elasticus]